MPSKCPKCGIGDMVEKVQRSTGETFYGCNKWRKEWNSCLKPLTKRPFNQTKRADMANVLKDQEFIKQVKEEILQFAKEEVSRKVESYLKNKEAQDIAFRRDIRNIVTMLDNRTQSMIPYGAKTG
jgi:hypothetical protein